MHPYLNIAVKAARSAGKSIIDAILHTNSMASVHNMQETSTVFELDGLIFNLEQIITENILRAYPKHNVVMVKADQHLTVSKDPTWLIDPINGKTNLIHGLPLFAVSIALIYNYNLEHAVIYNPMADELFVASKGSGAKLNDKRIRVAKQTKIAEALLAIDQVPDLKLPNNKADLQRSLGSAALQLAYVAAGRLDGYCGADLLACEVAAGMLLVREAGGYVTDLAILDREQDMIANNINRLLAGNLKIYQQLDLFAYN